MWSRTRWLRLLAVAALAGLLGGLMPPLASWAAPPGHALPFYGTYPILEGPSDDPDRVRRDAEGLEFGLPVMTPVLASHDGEVVFAGWQPPTTSLHSPLGVVLHIRHDDGTLSEYGYLNDPDVWVGKRVARGEFIAHSGLTGETDRPALYFAILIGTSGAGFDGRSVSLRDLPGLDWERGLAVGAGQVVGDRNLALGQTAWASSEEADNTRAGYAVDGDLTTRYSSGHGRQPEYLAVELGGRRVVTRAVVRWEEACPETWSVQVWEAGNGASNWREVWWTDQGGEEATFAAVEALAVRVVSEDHWRRGWSNVSIYELEVYGF